MTARRLPAPGSARGVGAGRAARIERGAHRARRRRPPARLLLSWRPTRATAAAVGWLALLAAWPVSLLGAAVTVAGAA